MIALFVGFFSNEGLHFSWEGGSISLINGKSITYDEVMTLFFILEVGMIYGHIDVFSSKLFIIV
jgi:hypothetical protein